MKFKKIVASVFEFMGIAADHKEKLAFTEDEKDKLDKHTGKEGFADKFEAQFNHELEAQDNAEAKKLYEEFMEQEAESSGDTVEGVKEKIEVDEKTATQQMKAIIDDFKVIKAENQQMKGQIAELEKKPEDDVPEAVIKMGENKEQVKHSKTHLFSSNKSWDQLDRPWNKSAADGNVKGSTTWNDLNIDKLNSDLQDYSRRNSSEIMSMIFDGFDIPEHWRVYTNIQDEFVFSALATGEITQGYKEGWLPKNKQRFVPQKNKIYDKQIDGFFTGKQLKSIEKSWLNMFFNEGSTPYKESFVRYLINEILKQARKEDKISLFKGVYKETPADASEPGHFINSMNGFLKILDQKRGTEYVPFTLGKITEANVYDKVNEMVEQLPHSVRNLPGLKFGMSKYWHRRYHDARELRKGTNMDYAAQDEYVEKFPNIEFTHHAQLDGSDFFYITPDDNIGVMVDRPGEESIITLEKDKRNINFFNDYKLGVCFKAFGAKVDASDELTYENQIFFSNEAEVLWDVYYPADADDATPSVADHYALSIGSLNTTATNITSIDDAETGDTIFLYGNSDTNPSTVVSSANMILDGGNFILTKGNTLTLKALSATKFIELDRRTPASAAAEEEQEIAADATTIDASSGLLIFVTSSNTQATALTNIENAVLGETYTVKGGSSTNPTTIATGTNFLLDSAFTANDGSYIKLYYNGTKFIEIERG